MADAAFAAALAAKKGPGGKDKVKDTGKGKPAQSPKAAPKAKAASKKSALQAPRRSEAEKTNPLAAAAALGDDEGARPASVAEFMEYVLNVNDGIEEYMNVGEDGQMQDDVEDMAGLAYRKSLRRGWSSTESLNAVGAGDEPAGDQATGDEPAGGGGDDGPGGVAAVAAVATSVAPPSVVAQDSPAAPEAPAAVTQAPTPEAPKEPAAPVAEATGSGTAPAAEAAEAAEAAMAEAAAGADEASQGSNEATQGFNEDEHVHANVNRAGAERLIRSRILDGTFLVRRKAEGEFVVSVWVAKLQTVEHHKLVLDDGTGRVMVNNKPIGGDCATLPDVVNHLRAHPEDMSTRLAAADALADGAAADGGVFVHEGMGRKDAEALIRLSIPNGMFLIRQGDKDGDFKISLWSRALQKVCHHNCTKQDGVYLMKLCRANADKEFDNLTKSMSAECTTLDAVVQHLRASEQGLGGVDLTTALLPQDL